MTGCGTIMKSVYGLKEPRPLTEKEIAYYAKKYEIPNGLTYQLDTSYFTYLFSLDTTLALQRKNHYQPLQALYYDKQGQLVSFHINCNAGGFPNLQWNRDGILNTFLPKSQTTLDTIVQLSTQFRFLKPLGNTQDNFSSFSNYDYVVVIYWNHFLTRQTKRFIKSFTRNCANSNEKKVALVFVNNDNIYALKEDASQK
jgi:hypothetical protein